MFQPTIQNDETELLVSALLSLETKEEAYRFLEDLLTVQEMKNIAQRMKVAVMLRKKVIYDEIAETTGASKATISRVNRSLQYGADGYHQVLDALGDKE